MLSENPIAFSGNNARMRCGRRPAFHRMNLGVSTVSSQGQQHELCSWTAHRIDNIFEHFSPLRLLNIRLAVLYRHEGIIIN